METLEARAAAKAAHMAELDARFELLQLARATSSASLAPAGGSSTSLATLTSSNADACDELTCVICMEKPTDATLVHGTTAHVCCCLLCAHNLQLLQQACPMCRKPIESVLQLFFA